MRRPARRHLALLGLAVAAFAGAAPAPFEASDLPADPAVVWGRLDNGLRYALRANHEPRGRASLRLAVAAGSLNETEDQRGLAHFLEHLAFDGSTHFPPGTLIEYLQRLGLGTGSDTNAFTSFDRTIYQLELPDTAPATVTQALTVFADIGGGLLLEPGAIDKERGIILSEKRARDSIEFRQFVGEFEFLLPETRFPLRIPIGLEPVIAGATRAQFKDFYDTWYRPDLMVLVAVGDFDPAAVEAQLRVVLGPLAARGPARRAPSLGRVDATAGVVAHLQPEPEAPAVHVAIETIAPYAHEADTAANRLKYLPRALALGMLNRRLDVLQKQEGAPFLGGSVGVAEQYDFFRNASVELTCRPDQWRAALAVGEQELRRALQFGFQPAELAEAVARQRNGLEQAARAAATRTSPLLADALVGTILERNCFTHPQTELDLYGPALDRITPDGCTAALRETWDDRLGRRIFVTGNLALEDADRQIVASYQASRAVALAPPEKLAAVAFAYTDFGRPGVVARTQEVSDLGVTLIEFRNGVRLNLKPTDFEAGRIRVGVRVGAGRLVEPPDKPGLSFLASNLLLPGGLGRHSADDLQRLLAGHSVATGFGVNNDAFVFAGATNRKDLALQLEVICAYLTDPGYRPEGFRQVRSNLDPFYTRLAHQVEGPFESEVPRLMAGDDSRFGLPPQSAVAERTPEEVRDWLAPDFGRGPIEVAVVGDIDSAAVVDAVARTFGALPARVPRPPYEAERRVAFPAAPLTRTFFVPTEIPKGLVQILWPATDDRDVHVARRLNLLARILEDRLRVKLREQLGETYSPEAGATLSDTFRGFGLLVAEATVAPAQAHAVAATIKSVADELQRQGVTRDELERARAPALTAVRESQRTNAYWLGAVLAAAQEHPERLDWSRTRISELEGVTAAELTALAARYLDPARASEFISVPVTSSSGP